MMQLRQGADANLRDRTAACRIAPSTQHVYIWAQKADLAYDSDCRVRERVLIVEVSSGATLCA